MSGERNRACLSVFAPPPSRSALETSAGCGCRGVYINLASTCPVLLPRIPLPPVSVTSSCEWSVTAARSASNLMWVYARRLHTTLLLNGRPTTCAGSLPTAATSRRRWVLFHLRVIGSWRGFCVSAAAREGVCWLWPPYIASQANTQQARGGAPAGRVSASVDGQLGSVWCIDLSASGDIRWQRHGNVAFATAS